MYEIHDLANIVAMADSKEQQALTDDIEKNGQREPAVLWNNKIVDGRCRQLACTTLNKDLHVRELDPSLTEGEVATIVKSLNTRRNLTMSQKIMSAVKEQERTGITNKEAAKQWAISDRSLKSGKYIKKYQPDLIDSLFDGKSVTLYDPEKDFDVTSNKVNTVARIIKKQIEIGVVRDRSKEVSLEWSVDGLLQTEAAKDWYYTTVSAHSVNDRVIAAYLVELANYKFQMSI